MLVLSECAHSHTQEKGQQSAVHCWPPPRPTGRGVQYHRAPPHVHRRRFCRRRQHAAGRRAAMVASFSLTFFYSEKAYITYNTLIFAVEHRCYWFKKPAKKCKSGFISSCLFLYTDLRLIHGALGLYLISIVNVVMHTNSLLSSVLLRAAPRQCGGGEAQRGAARRGCCSKAQAQRLDSLAVMIPTDSSVDDQRGSHAIRPCRCAFTSY